MAQSPGSCVVIAQQAFTPISMKTPFASVIGIGMGASRNLNKASMTFLTLSETPLLYHPMFAIQGGTSSTPPLATALLQVVIQRMGGKMRWTQVGKKHQ